MFYGIETYTRYLIVDEYQKKKFQLYFMVLVEGGNGFFNFIKWEPFAKKFGKPWCKLTNFNYFKYIV